MAEEQRRTRRVFDEAFKRDAVALLLKGDRKVKQLAQELGVSQWNLRSGHMLGRRFTTNMVAQWVLTTLRRMVALKLMPTHIIT